MDQQKQKKKTTEVRRGAKGSGTVRQRPDGKWEARCMINGKRRSFYADKQSEALKAMRTAQKEMDDGEYFETSNFSKISFEKWLDIWLEEYKKNELKPTTYYKIYRNLEKHIKPALGKIKLCDLDTTHIQRFCNGLLSNNLTPGTVKELQVMISCALKKAVELRYIKYNAAEKCTLPKIRREEIKPLTESEIVAFLKELENGERLKDLFTTILFTGMRRGEAIGLPWDAIDFKSGTITIKQQICRGIDGTYVSTPKNGKSRVLKPAPFVMDILQRVKREQSYNRLKFGLGWKNEQNLVFTQWDGTPLSDTNVNWRFKEIAKKIGRPDARLHDLRHTYAVVSLQEGDDPKTVQENLGHATASFTLEVYAHVSEKMRDQSAKRIQAYYEELNNA